MLERNDILARLPHRPPFMFVEHVESLEQGVAASGLTSFSPDSPVFAGHFPGAPTVPGVILVECFAQVAMLMLSPAPSEGATAPDVRGRYLVKLDRIVFKAQVGPGAAVRIDVRLLRALGPLALVEGTMRSGEKPVMTGEITVYDAARARAGR